MIGTVRESVRDCLDVRTILVQSADKDDDEDNEWDVRH